MLFDGVDLFDLLDVVSAGFGQRDGAGGAVKEAELKLHLGLFYRRAEPWLGYVEHLGSL